MNGLQKENQTKYGLIKAVNFSNSSCKQWLKDNEIKLYPTYNEGKSVVSERFIRTLKNKIYKRMTAVSKNVYFNVLDNIVDKDNNTYHKTIKTKPTDVKSGSCAKYDVGFNAKDPKFKTKWLCQNFKI